MSIKFTDMIRESSLIIEGLLGYEVKNTSDSLPQADNTEEVKSWIDDSYKATNDACYKTCFGPNGFLSTDKIYDKNRDIGDFGSEPPFWEFIMKQQVIISAYDRIRKIIADLKPQSIYNFTRLMFPYNPETGDIESSKANKSTTKLYGLSYLISHGYNCSENRITTLNSITFKKRAATKEESEKETKSYSNVPGFTSSKGNNSKTTKNLYKKLNGKFNLSSIKPYNTTLYDIKNHQQNDLYIHDEDERAEKKKELIESNNYVQLLQINTLELFQLISGRNENGLQRNIEEIIHSHTIGNDISDSYSKNCKELLSYIQIPGFREMDSEIRTKNASGIKVNFTLADTLYARYLIEKIFCISTIDFMSNRLSNSKHKRVLDEYFETFSLGMLLPNPFGRDLIMDMAISSMSYDYREKLERSDEPTKIVMQRYNTLSPIENDFLKPRHWASRYEDMIKVLHRFIFPVYENHFFLQLWNNARKSCESDTDCIDMIFDILTTYLNDNDTVKSLLSIDTAYKRRKEGGFNGIHFHDTDNANFDFFEKSPSEYRPLKKCIERSSTGERSDNDIPPFITRQYINKLEPGICTSIINRLFNSAINLK